MLLENLKLLVKAGTDALMETCGMPVDDVSINQIRQGQITFPGVAKLKFQNGTLESVRLGGDTMLCGHLAEYGPEGEAKPGMEKLAETFLALTLDGMEGRYPRGVIENLDVGPRAVHTRGTRTFGVKFRTPIGQLFVLAEVPSRLEYEQAKGSEYLGGMLSTYLPTSWSSRETIDSTGVIDSFLVLLRKVEGDINVEMGQEGGVCEERNGILIEQCSYGKQRALRVNLNLEHGPASLLNVGDKVCVFVGIADRAVEMDLEYLGAEAYPVAGGGTLDTALFSLPSELRVGQRRRAFRIDLQNSLPVEVEAVDVNADVSVWFANSKGSSGSSGQMIDLSFSGARIIGNPGEFVGEFPKGAMVRCRVFFPDEPAPVSVLGMVRRRDTKLVDRQTYQDEIGVEFAISPEADRDALEKIRQYVLKEQRSVLARRTQGAGAL
jgi:hypothetical protein